MISSIFSILDFIEIGVMYFKIAETMKGGVFSKGAMAIRQCETPITNKKEVSKFIMNDFIVILQQ
jgi:hypothetical protein